MFLLNYHKIVTDVSIYFNEGEILTLSLSLSYYYYYCPYPVFYVIICKLYFLKLNFLD